MKTFPLRCVSSLDFSRSGIFLGALATFWAAFSLTSVAVSAQDQAPPPTPKSHHAPRTLPLGKFYETPEPLPAGKSGELIRSEQAYEYHLSYEASTFRILYHSLSAQGKDVAVSGVVLVPDGAPPAGGWPVIAWAHDFAGSARQCAPSLLKNLNEGPLLSMYASLGYAVVASDYAGLGTSSPHAAFDTRSNAMDLIFSIPAARAALPQLGKKWVVAGHSQGASVAVAVAEAVGEMGDPNYLGAVSIAGVADPQEMFERFANGPEHSMLVFLAQGVKTVFPEFRIEEMLAEKAIPVYQYIGNACEAGAGPQVAANEMLKPGWENNPYIKEFWKRNKLGGRPAHSPLLVISGEADTAVPAALTARAVSQLCQQKDHVLFVKYPGLNESAVLGNSVSEQISWIKARFSGLPAPSNCPYEAGARR
jgi:pimeloyl-ACP methyl ester carboxylesterase